MLIFSIVVVYTTNKAGTEKMAVIEFKNDFSRIAIMRLLNPKPLEPKIAYQKFKNGRPVLTLITRD